MGYQVKSKNDQNKQTKTLDIDTSMVVTRGKGRAGGDVLKGKEAQIQGDKRRFDFGWQTHSTLPRRCVTELYT